MRIEFTIPYFVEPKQGDRVQVMQRGGKVWARHHPKRKVHENAAALAVFCAQHRPAVAQRDPQHPAEVFHP